MLVSYQLRIMRVCYLCKWAVCKVPWCVYPSAVHGVRTSSNAPFFKQLMLRKPFTRPYAGCGKANMH